MKKIILTTLLACLAFGTSLAQRTTTWERPATEQGVYGDGYFNPAIDVTKVELKEAETLVYLTLRLRNNYDYAFSFSSKTYLQADGRHYALRTADGIELDKPQRTYNTGLEVRRYIVFHFEPLPLRTKAFDLIESESSMVQIKGIQPVEERWQQLFPSYWRDEQTGDWAIGLLDDCAIYQCKFWTYDRRDVNAKTGKAELVLRHGDETLQVRVDKNKQGRRTFRIGTAKKTYAMLTDRFMPDYPVSDKRATFADSGYRPDTITVVGWVKDMPEGYRKLKTFGFSHYEDLFDDAKQIDAELDEQGRFTMKIPVLNSSECYGDWKRCFVRTLLEPGKTYFMLYDFKEGRRYFMGDDVRLQNELFKFPLDWNYISLERGDDYAQYIPAVDKLVKQQYASIDSLCEANPSLSTRFKMYRKENCLWQQAREFAQGYFRTKSHMFTDEARRYAYQNYWTQLSGVQSRHRDTKQFIIDFFEDAVRNSPSAQQNIELREVLKEVDFDEQSAKTITRYAESWDTITETLKGIEDAEEKQRVLEAFNTRHADLLKQLQQILETPKVKEYVEKRALIMRLKSNEWLLDSLHATPYVREMIQFKLLNDQMMWSYRPLPQGVIDTAKTLLKSPVAIERLEQDNAHYAAIENREFDKLVLKSSDNLKDLTEGEALLKKILEPYKGRIVLLDVWGTWCGPCKEALSHSTEEYACLGKYDVTFLYLANNSPQKSWENVIKEHNVTGKNVAHYNLPREQQEAIERYLQVTAYPTYKLFDREGNLLDVKVDTRNLMNLEQVIKRLAGK